MKDCNGHWDVLTWRCCIGCKEQKECLDKAMEKESKKEEIK